MRTLATTMPMPAPADQRLVWTSSELTLNTPVAELPSAQRSAIATWLLAHDIDPETLAVGTTLVRDTRRRRLTWFEGSDDARTCRIAIDCTRSATAQWPAPFPETAVRAA